MAKTQPTLTDIMAHMDRSKDNKVSFIGIIDIKHLIDRIHTHINEGNFRRAADDIPHIIHKLADTQNKLMEITAMGDAIKLMDMVEGKVE